LFCAGEFCCFYREEEQGEAVAGGDILFWYMDSAGADKDILGVYSEALMSALFV